MLNEAKELGLVSKCQGKSGANASHATHKVMVLVLVSSETLKRAMFGYQECPVLSRSSSAPLDTKLITLMALPCSCQHRCLMTTMMSTRTRTPMWSVPRCSCSLTAAAAVVAVSVCCQSGKRLPSGQGLPVAGENRSTRPTRWLCNKSVSR